MVRIKEILAPTLVIGLLVIGGCSSLGSEGSSKQPITIGVIAPLTGSKASQGEQFKEGAELAVAEINESGGLLGREVDLEILDDRGEPNQAVAAAQKLASNRDVIAVIGPSSTASSSAAIPVLERAELPAISPAASTGSLVTDNQFFYIVNPPVEDYAPKVPQYAVELEGADSLAVLSLKDDWGEGTTEEAENWADENGVPIVAQASYTQGDRDFNSQLTSVLAENPDALILNTHYTEGALITEQG